MPNRILKVELQTRRADPVRAEIWILVSAEQMTPGTEIRGRIIGPKCELATTIEVAYPFRPLPQPTREISGLAARVIIPEPSLWEPETRFTYDVLVELWQDFQCCDRYKHAGYCLQAVNRIGESSR